MTTPMPAPQPGISTDVQSEVVTAGIMSVYFAIKPYTCT